MPPPFAAPAAALRRRAWLDRPRRPQPYALERHRTLAARRPATLFRGQLLGKIPVRARAACAAGDAAVVACGWWTKVPGGCGWRPSPPAGARPAGSTAGASHRLPASLARGRRPHTGSTVDATPLGAVAPAQGAPVEPWPVVAGHGRHQDSANNWRSRAALNRQLATPCQAAASCLCAATAPVDDRPQVRALLLARGACDREAAQAEGHLSE